jgi:hypothetical protein
MANIVRRFNDELSTWHGMFGCTAEFSWKYDREGRKYLDVREINLAVHRAAAPDGQTLRDAMAQYQEDPA